MSSTNGFHDLTDTLDALGCIGASDDFNSVAIKLAITGFSNAPKFRYALIEWVAKSHDNTVKHKRKQLVAKVLDSNTMQVERLLKHYKAGDLNENSGNRYSSRKRIRIDPYWLHYMEYCWEKSLRKKTPLRGIDVYREVRRHAELDCIGKDVPPFPCRATVYRIVNPWIAERDRKQGERIRNLGFDS